MSEEKQSVEQVPHEEQSEQKPGLATRFMDRSIKQLEKTSARWGGKNTTPTLLLFTILLFLILMVVWASVAELDHVVRGQGKVVTPKQTQLIQSLEGGIIERIYVREGDAVPEGSILIALDPTQAKSLYGEAKREESSLMVRVERLRAEKEARAPVFSFEMLRDETDLIAAEKAQLNERKEALDTEIQLLSAQVDQRAEERHQAHAELERAEKEFMLANQEYELIKDLVERKLEARLSLISADRERNDAVAKLNTAKVSVKRSDAVLAEANYRLSQARMNFISEVGDELAANLARLAEVKERLNGLADRLNRTQLLAPLDAVVNKIHVRTEGGVVQPGEPILELTPIDGKIEIEATIQQKDIAFVFVEQDVSVKLTAFDFARFGDVTGKVTFISPDAIKAEDGTEFFQVRIQLDRSYIEGGGKNYAITPGMAANVDMVVSKRTVMDYLVEPVLKLKDRAFRE